MNPSTAARIHLHQAGRSFEGRAAIAPLDLKIEPGEFVSILGPSGSGKSTLLRLMAGLDRPDTGHIEINSFGREFFRAFVFQEAALLPWRNVLQNVMLPLELMGLSKRDSKEKALEALRKVQLEDALALHANQLSGGMKMRVSVARALVAEPSLLLLDEPFAALDESSRHRLQEDLRNLWASLGMTVVFVTHSVSEAVFLSNRAVIVSSRPAKVIADRKIALPSERTRETRMDQRFLLEMQSVAEIFS